MWAVCEGRDESTLRLLLEEKADVNVADEVPGGEVGGWCDGVGRCMVACVVVSVYCEPSSLG